MPVSQSPRRFTVASSDLPSALASAQALADSKFGSKAAAGVLEAFDRFRHAMLFCDNERRWVTGNAAACELFGVTREEIAWRRIDDFTPATERTRLCERWQTFLTSGAAEGRYKLDIPGRGAVPVEFSAIANVLPARHLSIFISPEESPAKQADSALACEAAWTAVVPDDGGQLQLTSREREVMTLVASGLQSGDVAERLFLSPETVKSHVHNAMEKLGSHTRAHAVAIAMVTGQISWEG